MLRKASHNKQTTQTNNTMKTELSDYQKRLIEEHKSIEALTSELAKILKGTVKPKRDLEDWNCEILLDMGMSIYVRFSDHKKTHFYFIGGFPRNHRGECHFPRDYDKLSYKAISCSVKKSAQQIAKDIQNRFLPTYTEAYMEMLKRAQNDDSYYNESTATAKTLAAFVGTNVHTEYHSKKAQAKFSISIKESSVNVECRRDQVCLDISYITREVAEQILAILKNQ